MQTHGYKSRHRLVAIGLEAIMCGCNREKEEFVNGETQARQDSAAGESKIAFAEGTNLPAFWKYTDLLRKRYNRG